MIGHHLQWCPISIIIKTMRKQILQWIVLVAAVCIIGCGGQGQSQDDTEKINTEYVHVESTFGIESGAAEDMQSIQRIVKVAVIDTGFSPEAIPDECVLEGKNYLYPESSTVDTYGHGTAVASIILQYAPDVKLIPLVSNAYDGRHIEQVDNDTLAQMIVDAVDVYKADIINISAGLILDKEAVRDAIAYAEEAEVLVVASAGNDYDLNGSVPYYPAAYDSVLAVGSLNKEGTELATFSQRGEWVDVYVIGEDVTIGTLSGNTRTSSGTSYSAAQITAVAANLWMVETEMTVSELKDKMVEYYPNIYW